MRISDWSSDVCSSDLILAAKPFAWVVQQKVRQHPALHDLHPSSLNTCRITTLLSGQAKVDILGPVLRIGRSEEHTSELQSLMRISYAVFCLIKKKTVHSTITVQFTIGRAFAFITFY